MFYNGSKDHILRAADLCSYLSGAIADVPKLDDLSVAFIVHFHPL